MAKTLTTKERQAVENYILTEMKSKPESYKHAYDTKNYKPNTVKRRATELFKRPHVAEYLEAVVKRQAEAFDVQVTDIKRMLVRTARIGFQEVAIGKGGEQYVKQLDPGTGLKALDTLNKMNGNYAPEKRELSGPDGGPIQTKSFNDFYTELVNDASPDT